MAGDRNTAIASLLSARGTLTAALPILAAALAAGCVRQPQATACATGIYCPAGSRCAARQAVCIFDSCGDGVLQPGEACDDGNKVDGDGCSADCTSNETCGNGVTDKVVGEVCDDANTVGGDGCSADCRSTERCGNLVIDPGEECDFGGVETAICNASCTLMRHGDGIVNHAAGEQCDGDDAGHGNGFDCRSATCNANCTISRHGDGIVNPLDGEQCDGGNGADCRSATCNADCTASRCGDAIVNPQAGEVCDDGNTSNEDDCLATCRRNTCGDGFVDRNGPDAVEACDLGARLGGELVLRNGDRSCPYGLTSCDGCTTACQPMIPAPTPHYCGDGVKDTPLDGIHLAEQCDSVAGFVCGTCSGCRTVAKANPRGTITVTSTAVADADSLTIEDGTNTATIEFDTGDGCQPSALCVSVSGAAATSDVASRIVAATSGWRLTITASRPADPSEVRLENTAAGITGDIAIATAGSSVVAAPAQAAIVVTGMAGGVGCPVGGLCESAADCISGKCSRNRVCAP
jgi:cysteine-rich repeat protein